MVQPYLNLREETAARDRSLREKVMSLEAAASLVSDGNHVALGGCTLSRTPMAMIRTLIREKKKNLKISRSIVSTEGDLLYVSGVSQHILTSWFSQGIVWGISKVMRHYTETKQARFEEWSHMSIGLRFRAGAMGIPFMPTRSMLGSGVAGQLPDVEELDCPYTGERLMLLPALNPDVALIHVQRCDAYGNAQIDGLHSVVTVEALSQSGPGFNRCPVRPQDVAFLQYTSGSTGNPKGVILTHDNLLANIRVMGQVVDIRSTDVFVSWLPLYHDMGLIGAWLGSLYFACRLVLMSPLTWW